MSTDLARLPPLDLLRGFVAVGRRMSITLAAQDLHLTQSAISRQVRALEDHLGVALLTRGFRSVSFTAEGARLFRLADPWMTELGELTALYREPQRRAAVTVTTTIGVASLWLLPRLGEFQAAHPGVDVRVAADNRLLDLSREHIDIAIRYCTPAQAPRGARRMFGEALAPVAHPSLGLRKLDRAALARHTLLEFDGQDWPWLHWQEWLAAHGLAKARPKAMLRLNQYDQVVHAALAGHGIALGRLALVEPMLRDGRLVAVGQAHPIDADGPAYWLVRSPLARGAEAGVVADWLHEQAKAMTTSAAASRAR
ncbi:LysR substrate-binding domain-containing protein [Bordetella genomosp. 13]|uniref:LysR family transcriptional regulator n=1 Tax=Bordetella genomosp. 13 TaxID=463040 RepID=A0A1W6Z755_9BORD|nr:LysR substrate-binding domain-containing protein [Bordetella genomosp. 13]ARP93213.1 LysR family transcriptional regulator [Bordetella genomosp. 13]